VRSPEGTITLFDPPFCLAMAASINDASINDEGVITGDCAAAAPPFPIPTVGWVRFP
jgi:hypothetical protein